MVSEGRTRNTSVNPTVGKDGLDLGLVALLELDDGSSREGGEHRRLPPRRVPARGAAIGS